MENNQSKYTGCITIEAGKRSGQPCIRGLRMTVKDVLGYLAAGMTVEELLADFPELEKEDVEACVWWEVRFKDKKD